MASFAIFSLLPSSSSFKAFSFRKCQINLSQTLNLYKPLIIKASTSIDFSLSPVTNAPTKNNEWLWKYKKNLVNSYYKEPNKGSDGSCKNISMIPTISHVSIVEEWRSVAKDNAKRTSKANYRTTIVDWPRLGYSNILKLDFNVDVMEKFLVDFININAPDGPVNNSNYAYLEALRKRKAQVQ